MHSEAVSTIIEQLQQNPRNVFVEGIQGAGKTTLLNALQQKLPAYTVYHEGDISPVDLAWCSYVTDRQYTDICQRYPQLLDQLAAYTKAEEHHKIIAYTRITTELQDFYPFMSQFEIYSGRFLFQPSVTYCFVGLSVFMITGVFSSALFFKIVLNRCYFFTK